jgi:hypothetical protein
METHTPTQNVETPKSASYQRHQRQRLWQIIAPVVLGSLVILVLLALIIHAALGTSAGGPVSRWADTSLIWLSLPVLLFALVTVLILILMIYLVGRLLKTLPDITFMVQHYARMAASFVISWADKLTAPIIKVEGVKASAAALLSSLFSRRKA